MSKSILEYDNLENNRKYKVRHHIQCIRIWYQSFFSDWKCGLKKYFHHPKHPWHPLQQNYYNHLHFQFHRPTSISDSSLETSLISLLLRFLAVAILIHKRIEPTCKATVGEWPTNCKLPLTFQIKKSKWKVHTSAPQTKRFSMKCIKGSESSVTLLHLSTETTYDSII